jgi:hypothetical protein
LKTHGRVLRYGTPFVGSNQRASSHVLVLSSIALALLAFGATLVFLHPSDTQTQKSVGDSSSDSTSSASSITTTSISTSEYSSSSTTVSTQTYPSYQPPKNDTILLNNPCRWWCVSNNYDWYILNDSALFGVPDPMIIKAQIALESSFDPNATSRLTNLVCGGNTDYGLMQINPNCNNVNKSELFIPSYNLYWGTRFWANDYLYLQQKWGNSCNSSMLTSGVLELYNGGADFIGSSCGSFPRGMNYIGLVSMYYYPFCQNANYVPITQLPNDTSTNGSK